ncbi:MAG: 3-oxoacyl-[acyl-carrier-protein] reductase [Thermoleophilia bacterium]|jgi:3-oxoacyl-[acyl-carrier protein] reductase
MSEAVLNPLEGRVALVTGAGRGIGREIALRLGQLGADVVVNDVARPEAAEGVVAELEAMGRRGAVVLGDVSSADDVKAIVETAEAALGPIDILVNNAGLTRDGLFVRMEEADWDLVLDVNLKGAFLMSKAVARGMMKRRSGSIVNLSSVVGRRGNAGQANYSAAKAGLIGLTKTLARELASRGIRVNAVAPGYIQTEMTAALPDEVKATIAAGTPLNRLGDPRDVAEAVAFLAGDGAGFITGVVLPVDGGLGI